jgi:hypothetical protein
MNLKTKKNQQPWKKQRFTTNTTNAKQNSAVNATIIGKKYVSQTPPFLLTFEIFNKNVHNCLIDFRASFKCHAYFMCKKLNVEPIKCSTHIIQLDIYEVKVIGELKDVLIRLSSNPKGSPSY